MSNLEIKKYKSLERNLTTFDYTEENAFEVSSFFLNRGFHVTPRRELLHIQVNKYEFTAKPGDTIFFEDHPKHGFIAGILENSESYLDINFQEDHLARLGKQEPIKTDPKEYFDRLKEHGITVTEMDVEKYEEMRKKIHPDGEPPILKILEWPPRV